MCSECALHARADCKDGVAYSCRNKTAPDRRCAYTSHSFLHTRPKCYREGVLRRTPTHAETSAREMCELLKLAIETCTNELLGDPSICDNACGQVLQQRSSERNFKIY